MINFLNDDLNSVGAIGLLFENINSFGDELCVVKSFVKNVLGLTLEELPEKRTIITPEIQTMINKRNEARENKEWSVADSLRDKLIELGVEVKDK